MKSRLTIVLTLSLLLFAPSLLMAAGPGVHFFDCKECHLDGYAINELGAGNICTRCHGNPTKSTVLNPGSPQGVLSSTPNAGFSSGDASNHYGNNPAPVAQTSHNWSASSTNPEAGAVEPTVGGFRSRYGATRGKVACSRCHNPHGEYATNPKLLTLSSDYVTPMTPNDMCLACHRDFAGAMSAPGNHGLLTHPLINDYPTFQADNSDRYKAVTATYNAATPYATGVQLVDGAITCVTCHGLHATDSNAATDDGFASSNLGSGDGLLLRGNGIQFTATVSGDESANGTFPTGTSICTECHNYESATHSGDHGAVGCLACHGGHEYNGGVPNIYMLNDPTGSYAIDPANIASLDKSAAWAGNTPGVIDGFCENCHGNVESDWDAVRNHSANIGEDCTTCHQNHSAGAFSEPLGCDGCHGSPPSVNDPGNADFGVGYDPSGYAWVDATYNYTQSGHVKDESLTPHSSHAGTTSRYGYTCSVCHNTHLDDFAGTHNIDNTSFRDVLENGHPFDPKAVAAGAANPSYADASGTCNTVYCHSNGGVNNGSGSRTFTFKAPTWEGTKGTIAGQGTECSSCHGNASGAMGSATHDKHIAAAGHAYGCNVCHAQTATSSTALVGVPATPPATHVNQTVNVAFDSATAIKAGGAAVAHGATPYSDATAMTCSAVYCHSSGQYAPASRVYKTISWNTAGLLTCTSCHNVPSASQTTAHQAHVVGSASSVGRDLECAVCHDDTMDTGINNALGTGGLVFHVNGVVNVNMKTALDSGNCSNISCHSDGNLDSVTDHSTTANAKYNNPIWTATGGYNACDTCHGDDATNKSYPAYSDGGFGTGDANSHNKHVASSLISCEQCHKDTSLTGTSLNGDLPSKHVNQTIDVVFRQGGTFNAGDTCSSTYCHGTGPSPAWGDTSPLVCNTCHNANNVLANSHPAHYESATVAVGADFTAANNSNTNEYIFNCGNCHSTGISHAGGEVSTNQAAEVVLAGSGTYTADSATSAGTDRGFSYTAGSCTTNDCHNDGTAAQGAPNYNGATLKWSATNLPADCTGCHNNNAAAVGNEMATGSHGAHMNDGSIMADKLCETCHTATVDNTDRGIAEKSLHANQVRNVDVEGNWDSNAIPGDNWNGADCTNVYCHSDGQGAYQAVTWGATINDCVSCHEGASAGTTLSGSHQAHTFNAGATIGRNLGCQECHGETASNNTTINDATKHVNKATDLYVLNFGTPKADCSAVECHSDGNYDSTSGGSGPTYNNPTWGASYACYSCHGDGASLSYPTYGNSPSTGDANSHAAHVGSYTCNECHTETSTVGTSINGTNTLKHVNETVDVSGASIGSFLGGTCSTVACHGGNNADWGASLGCRDCHGDATTDVDDFVYGNGIFAKIANDEWIYSGHGLDASATYEYTGRSGANFENAAGTGDACLYCHDSTIDHGLANLFRLRDNGEADLNGACLACHKTGTTAFDPDGAGGPLGSIDVTGTVKVDKYHGGAGHNATDRDAGRWCWDCHDPHGDAEAANQLIQMVQRNPQNNPDAYGVPASLRTLRDVVFYNSAIGAGVGGFARDIAGDAASEGICNSCHTTTAQYTVNTGRGSHPDSACTSCHKHSEDTTYDEFAFAGSGCNGCHGGGYTTGGAGDNQNYWPDSVNANPENTAGRHEKHMEELAFTVYSETLPVLLTDTVNGTADEKQRELCSYCHDNPGVEPDHLGNLPLPAEVNSMYTIWDKTADNGVFDQGGAETCATVDCHFNQTTTVTAPNDYTWYGTDTSNCVMCHTDVPNDAKSHTLHTDTNTWAFGCSDCHVGTPVWTDATTQSAPIVDHINGAFLVTSTDRTFTYTQATGSCDTNECHNDGTGIAPAASTYAWLTGKESGFCMACHAFPVTTDNHVAHLAASSSGATERFLENAIDCTECHTNRGFQGGTSADHLDASVSMLAAMNYSGTVTPLGSAVGTCSTTTCHNTGDQVTAKETPLWDRTPTAADDCSNCHSDVTLPDNHPVHIGTNGASSYVAAPGNQSIAGEYRFDCGYCHSNAIANHIDGGTYVDAVGTSYSLGVCSANTCHDDGDGNGANLDANWVSGWVGDDGDTCNNCHDNAPGTGAHDVHAIGIHSDTLTATNPSDIYDLANGGLLAESNLAPSAHGDGATSTVINCSTCHFSTTTDWSNANDSRCASCHDTSGARNGDDAITVTNKSNHVDGTKTVAFMNIAVKSKAQVRQDITTVPELDSNWTRTTGYKGDNDYDLAKSNLTSDDYTDATCTTACHNGKDATWTVPANDCMACHTSLPQ